MWSWFQIHYIAFKVINKAICKIIDLILKGSDEALNRIVFECIISYGNEYLFELVYKLVKVIVFGLLKFFINLRKGGGILGDVTEVVDSIFGDIIGR